MGRRTDGARRTGAASGGRARSVFEANRRARIAAELAVPLPLGAAVDDHAEWPENKLQALIVDLVHELDGKLQRQHPNDPAMRMLAFHDVDSRRNVAGLPDLIIVGPGGVIFAELKRQDRKAQARPQQKIWLAVLAAAGAAVYLWRPADWMSGEIQNELYRISRPRERVAARPARAATGRPMGCGCPAGTSPAAHTCEVWGPPPAQKR